MDRSVEQVREEWLVLRSQSGERAALEELVARFQPRLILHARYLTGGRADVAMDIVQESWIAIIRGIARIDDPAKFRAWAYRIVTNKCADAIRETGRERQVVRDRPAPEPSDEDSGDDIDSSVIREAMARLGVEQRTILSLRYLEDMSTREIAEILDVPQGTVKSRLHAARSELKTLLERSTHESP
jgi:RNA polymerase sigma factor (sigma-70 family)